MIRDWIDRQQCSHYDKRCRLTQAVIEIGRHDLINCFGVNDHNRSIGKDPGGLHPYPHQFSHESAYIDDIREIVSFLPKERRAYFCKPMLISLNVDGKDEKHLEPQDWENMISATNTSYEPLEKLATRFQLTLTKANCRGFEVTDEELEIAAEFINAANTKLQPTYSGTPHKTATGSGNDNGDKKASQKLEAPKNKQVTTVDGTCHADNNEHSSKTDVEGNNTHLAASNEVSHPEKVSGLIKYVPYFSLNGSNSL
ncbi:uncharacterized protein LOC115921363 [Strongylocentrotus purpuratus]|uniref:Uncharacterized protein n=1 Tax=Strongylocentrotus purpuratus TaxID=7668 RepID=A0A7M7SVP5_STRPU|nr:uncharacterized protein LOC115921363 [Strongylocentrotus purpuratus]